MGEEALELWKRRLEHLQIAQAKNADPISGWALKVEIEEARARIAELEGARPVATLAPAVGDRAAKLEILHLMDRLLQADGASGAGQRTGIAIKVAVLVEMPSKLWRPATGKDLPALLKILAWAEREKKLHALLEVLRELYNAPLDRPAPITRELIFISYSHIDKEWYNRLRSLLDADLELHDLICGDTDIHGGAVFMDEIVRLVERTRIMIMLGSAEYFDATSGAQREIQLALDALASGEMIILWFPVRNFNYRESPVGHLMAATGAGAIPLENLSLPDQKLALDKVHQEIRWHLGLTSIGLKSSPTASKRKASRSAHSKVPRPAPPSSVDFLIVTPLAEERDPLLARMRGYRKLPPSTEDIRVYYSSTIKGVFPHDGANFDYSVVTVPLVEMGLTEAATATVDAIRRWKPRYVLLVGIAGGLAKNDVNLGDVIIATQVADYELAKVTDEGSAIRWKTHTVDNRLLLAARNFTFSSKRVRAQRPVAGSSAVHFGPICTGNKVVATSTLADQFQDVWKKLIGVEMEAGGVANAVMQSVNKPGFFMVRGVSDLADGEKDSERVIQWREYACDIAAEWTIAFLKSGPVLATSEEER